MKAFEERKGKFFENLPNDDVVPLLSQLCIFPRCLHSEEDAIFCAKFIIYLHRKVPPFSTLLFCTNLRSSPFLFPPFPFFLSPLPLHSPFIFVLPFLNSISHSLFLQKENPLLLSSPLPISSPFLLSSSSLPHPSFIKGKLRISHSPLLHHR